MRIRDMFATFSLLALGGTVALWSFWNLYPYNPIEFKDNVLPVLNPNKQVKSGGYLLVSLDYCKNTNEVPLVSRTFADGILYDTPLSPVSYKGRGCGKVVIQIYVPKALPLGTYTLKNSYFYHVNPIRTMTVHVDTEKFEVIK